MDARKFLRIWILILIDAIYLFFEEENEKDKKNLNLFPLYGFTIANIWIH